MSEPEGNPVTVLDYLNEVRRVAEIRCIIGAFTDEVYAAVAHRDNRGGQQTSFHGELQGTTVSALNLLKRYADQMRAALDSQINFPGAL